jgi:hypothetical protein
MGNLAHWSKEQVEEALVSSLPKCTVKIWCESDKGEWWKILRPLLVRSHMERLKNYPYLACRRV